MDARSKREAGGSVLQALFDRLATGSRQEVQEAKRGIKKLWDTDSKGCKKAVGLILELMGSVDRIADAEHQAAVISGMSFFFMPLTDTHFLELSRFVLHMIEHPDGRVREAVRQVARWLRFKHTTSSMALERGGAGREERTRQAAADVRTYEAFLDDIERLIRAHAPADAPTHIGDAPSSVYKSAVLLWHDLSYRTSRDYEHRPELMDLSDKRFMPLLGHDDDDDEIDEEEIEADIWADPADGNPREGAVWLGRLEVLARTRFEAEIARLKFNAAAVERIMADACEGGYDAGRYLLQNLLPRSVASGAIAIADANNLVRELQAFTNHRVTQNDYGAISRLLVVAVVERECSDSGKPDDLAAFVKLVCESHAAIDEFLDRHDREAARWRARALKFSLTMHLPPADEGYTAELEQREREDKFERHLARSVAHHVLDWYIQTDPGGFNRTREPRKMAAYVLKFVRDHNIEATDCETGPMYENAALSKFGGWKGAGNLSSVSYKIERPLLERVGDPDLLLIDPAKATAAYRKKLASVREPSDELPELSNFGASVGASPMTKAQILARRAELERKLAEVLERTGSDTTVADVVDAIYHSEEASDLMKIMAMFERGEDGAPPDLVLELVNDAWNYFPHETLGGRSPAEMLLEGYAAGA